MAQEDLNVVSMVGRLTRDMEVKVVGAGFPIGEFSLATNTTRKIGDNYESVAHFFNCTLLGTRAQSIQQYMTKGKRVGIVGSLQQDRWTDKAGTSQQRVKIIVDKVQFLDSKQQENNHAEYAQFNDDLDF